MSSLSGGNTCLKYLVFIFNFLFFVVGCGILGIGIWLKVGNQDYIDVTQELTTETKYLTAGNLMIGVGVIVVIVAFFGCCGAIKENPCMLLVFFVLLLIIFILELAVGIFAYVKRTDVETQLRTDFRNAILTEYQASDNKTAVNVAIDKFQSQFKCCGFDNYLNWQDSKYHTETGMLPASCCKEKNSQCPTKNPDLRDDVYNQEGCFVKVIDYFKKNILIVGAACIVFAVIQLLGLIFSMMLFRAIKKSGTVV